MTIVEKVIAHCRSWAKRVRKVTGAEAIYIFGSTIHRDGTQFDPERSDLDLIVVIPKYLKYAPSRTDWLVKLQTLKRDLELSLIPLLSRNDAAPPIVSVVPLTKFELRADIHKSPSRVFFRNTNFMDLLRNTKPAPLRRGAAFRVDHYTRETFQFTQSVRNKFLSVSASAMHPLLPWNDASDPLPKEIIRHAAIG